jgi:hypothetical protein
MTIRLLNRSCGNMRVKKVHGHQVYYCNATDLIPLDGPCLDDDCPLYDPLLITDED